MEEAKQEEFSCTLSYFDVLSSEVDDIKDEEERKPRSSRSNRSIKPSVSSHSRRGHSPRRDRHSPPSDSSTHRRRSDRSPSNSSHRRRHHGRSLSHSSHRRRNGGSPSDSSHHRRNRGSPSGSPFSNNRSDHSNEKDQETKQRARESRSNEFMAPTGAVASTKTIRTRSLSPHRRQRRNRDEKDRDAKQRSYCEGHSGEAAVLPGAVASSGGHKSRHNKAGRTKSPVRSSTGVRRSKSSDGDCLYGTLGATSKRDERDRHAKGRSKSPLRSSSGRRERDSKASERESRGAIAATPGAVLSTTSYDRTAVARKSNRHSQKPPLRSKSHNVDTNTTADEDSKIAKRRAHGKPRASAPGVMTMAGPTGGPASTKKKSKSGNHQHGWDLFEGGGEIVVNGGGGGGSFKAEGDLADMAEEQEENAKITTMVNATPQAPRRNIDDDDGEEMDKIGSVRENQDHHEQGLASKRICFLLIAILLIGGSIVGILFGKGVIGPKEEPAVVEETATPTFAVTNAPTTPAPTTNMPSSSPTYFLYGRPDLDDCDLIRSGQELANQTVVDRNYALSLEVELSLTTNPELFFDTLRMQIQRNIMPKLAGCDSVQVQRRLGSSHHDTLKFWIRNGLVMTLIDEGTCEPTKGSASCFKVEVDVSLYVADEEDRNLYLIGRISDAFKGNLLQELGLGAPFDEIRFIALRTLDPTEQPSPSPSMLPSKVPTMVPTDLASSRPSMAPLPTRAPTITPTAKTEVPTTPKPTEEPTASPTPFPTAMPAPGVTPGPTISPSESPSSVPSFLPSGTPSIVPSSLPSTTPSGSPTPNPTNSPSNNPSDTPTKAPTVLPTQFAITGPFDRTSDIARILENYGISNPDSMALNWLVNTDTWEDTTDFSLWVDRYGMVAFYQKAGKSSWLQSGVTHCDWEKVTCVENRVGEMNLKDTGLSTVPTEIGHLTKLTKLEFQNDDIADNGKIPPAITQLSNLKNLNMISTGVTNIGSEILNMESLDSLWLRGNSFGSTIPTHLYSMTKLTWLNLKECSLEGAIPSEIGQLSKLTYLDISSGRLTKPFPQALTQLTDLRKLVAGSNPWDTTIPTWIGELTNLVELYFAWSSLSGTIPTEIAQMTSLTRLTFNKNSLTGSIPELPPILRPGVCSLQNNNFNNTTNKGVCSV